MEEEAPKKKIVLIVAIALFVVTLVVVIGLFLYARMHGAKTVSEVVGGVLPFGASTPSTGVKQIQGQGTEGGDLSHSDTKNTEPMFLLLSNSPTAGFYSMVKNGVDSVRYVNRENGHVFEVSTKTGESRQLTNTTIPRIHEAFWGLGGNAVILRYLDEDTFSKQDIIKTTLAYLNLPEGTSTDQIGSFVVDATNNLPDNILAISIAPNGKKLFYLLKTTDGVSGSIVDIATKNTKEVFRNGFSEWTPQLLDTDEIILTTKPSADVPGYSYRFNPQTKLFERIVRNKKGLTTLADPKGDNVLYTENLPDATLMGVYNKKGFAGDEGTVIHEEQLPLTTLPEKCAWQHGGDSLVCASFAHTSNGAIPDEWYQGSKTYDDTFWNLSLHEDKTTFIADPKKEVDKNFDVIVPSISDDNQYFVFINKTDSSLWRMKLPLEIESTSTDAQNDPLGGLSPEELKDATGTKIK